MIPNLPSLEKRSYGGNVRVAEPTADGKRVIRGLGAVFNSPSQVLSTPSGMQFVEVIAPGAFAVSLAAGLDIKSYYNHDASMPLGRQRAGTLKLFEDSAGLNYEAVLANRSYELDLLQSMERGDVFGSSFTFATVKDEWSEGPDGLPLRTLIQVHLFEVGPVTDPAYLAATAVVRSYEMHVEARRLASLPAPPHGASEPQSFAASHASRLLDFT